MSYDENWKDYDADDDWYEGEDWLFENENEDGFDVMDDWEYDDEEDW